MQCIDGAVVVPVHRLNEADRGCGRVREYTGPVVLQLVAEGYRGFNFARFVFQVPVTAELGLTRHIVTGGNISAGEQREFINQFQTLHSRSQVTAVDHQVSIII